MQLFVTTIANFIIGLTIILIQDLVKVMPILFIIGLSFYILSLGSLWKSVKEAGRLSHKYNIKVSCLIVPSVLFLLIPFIVTNLPSSVSHPNTANLPTRIVTSPPSHPNKEYPWEVIVFPPGRITVKGSHGITFPVSVENNSDQSPTLNPKQFEFVSPNEVVSDNPDFIYNGNITPPHQWNPLEANSFDIFFNAPDGPICPVLNFKPDNNNPPVSVWQGCV